MSYYYNDPDEVKFSDDILVDSSDGEIIFVFYESDPWYGTQRLYIPLERMKEIVAFAEAVKAKYEHDKTLREAIEQPSPL